MLLSRKLRNRPLDKFSAAAYDAQMLSLRMAEIQDIAQETLEDVYARCETRVNAIYLDKQILCNRAEFEDSCCRDQWFVVLVSAISGNRTLCTFPKGGSWTYVYASARSALHLGAESALLLWWDEPWLPGRGDCFLQARSDWHAPKESSARSVRYLVTDVTIDEIQEVD